MAKKKVRAKKTVATKVAKKKVTTKKVVARDSVDLTPLSAEDAENAATAVWAICKAYEDSANLVRMAARCNTADAPGYRECAALSLLEGETLAKMFFAPLFG